MAEELSLTADSPPDQNPDPWRNLEEYVSSNYQQENKGGDTEEMLQQITQTELLNQLREGTTIYRPHHSSHDYANMPGVDEASSSKDEAWAKKVYVSNIPTALSAPEIAKAFNNFGMVVSGGVVILPPKNHSRFGYGFVEFEDASSAENAVQAHVVLIGSHPLYTTRPRPPRNIPVQGGRGTGGSFSKAPGDGRPLKGNSP